MDGKRFCTTDFKEILGENCGRYEYGNLIAENKSMIKYYTRNLQTGYIIKCCEDDKKWGNTQECLFINSIVDGRNDTVYDFLGGLRNKISYNFVIQFHGTGVFDTIKFVSGGTSRYYPTKLNIYVANKFEDLFNSVEPIKSYIKKTTDGVYEFKGKPIRAGFIRIEIIDNDNDYYDDMIISVVKHIGVYGAINSKEENYGSQLLKEVNNYLSKPETVMQPYLYRDKKGYHTDVYKLSSSGIPDGIQKQQIGTAYATCILNGYAFINLGTTNDQTLISEEKVLANINEYSDLYFYIKASSKGEFSDGTIYVELVSGGHTFIDIPVKLQPDQWIKVDIFSYLTENQIKNYKSDDFEKKLRRIAIKVMASDFNTEVIVGSLLGVKSIDWTTEQINPNEILAINPNHIDDKFLEFFKKYNINV